MTDAGTVAIWVAGVGALTNAAIAVGASLGLDWRDRRRETRDAERERQQVARALDTTVVQQRIDDLAGLRRAVGDYVSYTYTMLGKDLLQVRRVNAPAQSIVLPQRSPANMEKRAALDTNVVDHKSREPCLGLDDVVGPVVERCRTIGLGRYGNPSGYLDLSAVYTEQHALDESAERFYRALDGAIREAAAPTRAPATHRRGRLRRRSAPRSTKPATARSAHRQVPADRPEDAH